MIETSGLCFVALLCCLKLCKGRITEPKEGGKHDYEGGRAESRRKPIILAVLASRKDRESLKQKLPSDDAGEWYSAQVQRSCKEASQRWRAAGSSASDLAAPAI